MAKPPKPKFGANAQVPSSKLSALADLADYAANPPACIASRVATQSLTSNVPANVTFDTEVFDNMSGFPGSGTTITVSDAGVYVVAAWGQFVANASGVRSLEMTQNGSVVLSTAGSAPSGGDGRLSCSGHFLATGGDTFALVAFQNSGSALNLLAARLSVVRASGT